MVMRIVYACNFSAPSFRDGARAPDPESRDSGLGPDGPPRN